MRKSWKRQKIIATLQNLFSQCVHSWRGFAEGVLQVVLSTILWFKWSVKKHCLAMILLPVWEIFLHENNCHHNSYRFSYKFAFILFFSFLTHQKQESGFQQVGGLVTRNISVFCLWPVALYFKAMPNQYTFLKEFSYMLFLFVF